MIKYQKKLPICPYKQVGTAKCDHKFQKGDCIFKNTPFICPLYKEWLYYKKVAENGSKPLSEVFYEEDDI